MPNFFSDHYHVSYPRFWKIIPTKALNTILKTSKAEPIVKTVIDTLFMTVVCLELYHVSLEQSLVETVFKTPNIFTSLTKK